MQRTALGLTRPALYRRMAKACSSLFALGLGLRAHCGGSLSHHPAAVARAYYATAFVLTGVALLVWAVRAQRFDRGPHSGTLSTAYATGECRPASRAAGRHSGFPPNVDAIARKAAVLASDRAYEREAGRLFQALSDTVPFILLVVEPVKMPLQTAPRPFAGQTVRRRDDIGAVGRTEEMRSCRLRRGNARSCDWRTASASWRRRRLLRSRFRAAP